MQIHLALQTPLTEEIELVNERQVAIPNSRIEKDRDGELTRS